MKSIKGTKTEKNLLASFVGESQARNRYTLNKKRAILITGTYIGEGFDNSQLDALIITMPISFKGKVIQYAGRLHRKHKTKMDVRIYDYVDEDVSILQRMYEKRLKTYRMMGYVKSDEIDIEKISG